MKKRIISKKKLLIFNIIILLILVFGIATNILLIYFKDLKNKQYTEMYLASNTNTVHLFDKKLNNEKSVSRGLKVKVYKNVKTENYYKIEYDNQIFYAKEDSLVSDINLVILEKEKYVRTNLTLYKNDIDFNILSYIKKGEKLEVTGYSKILIDGSVLMYKVKYMEQEGYVYSKYLVDTNELSLKNYDEEGTYLIHKNGLSDPYGIGGAGDLDYYPRNKPVFDDNIMPSPVKALYINSAAIKNIDEYIEVAKEIGANAFVIDIKDGALAYQSVVAKLYSETSYNYGNDTMENYVNNVKKAKENGFYVIGRIVTFNDTHYAVDNKDDVIVYKNNNQLFGGEYWLTPYSRRVWQYNVELAIEAIKQAGFNEIQFDYVRFPDRTTSVNHLLDFKNKYNESKAQAVQNFLMYATDEIHKYNVYVSADVFGESAGDYVTGYGQYWPAISNVVDVISGMPYPDHFSPHSYGINEVVWTVPEKLLTAWSADVALRQKTISTPALVRTWIQAYNSIREPYVEYDDRKIEEQIKGLYTNGLKDGFMTWSSSSNINKYRSFTNSFKVKYD